MNFSESKPNSISACIFRGLGTLCLSLIISCVAFSQSANNPKPFGNGITAKKFYSSTVDNKNVVWFLTEAGIVSYDATKWTLHNQNPGLKATDAKHLASASGPDGNELWIATTNGANIVASPAGANSVVRNYTKSNSKIVGDKVVAVAVGQMNIRWVISENGVAAIQNNNWVKNNYAERYPEDIFQYYPISSMAVNPKGDSLYVGTLGGGVMRFFKDQQLDAVSGASEFAEWGPILIPSDSVYSVYIAPDGVQWVGTSKGVGKHVGNNTLEGWYVYNTKSGLVDNLVQAIGSDSKGNVYFGTKHGLSVLNGENWKTYTLANGLVSNNILTIVADKNDNVWIGTDNGVSCLTNGVITNYQ